MPPPINPRRYSRWGFTRFADTVGDGTGEKNIIGLQTSPIRMECAENQSLQITRTLVYIEDNNPMRVERYGGLSDPLTNGIAMWHERDGDIVQEMLDPDVPIKTNGDWAAYAGDLRSINLGQPGNNALVAKWETDEPLVIGPNEAIVIDLSDDFTGLLKHYFVFQGRREYRS